MLVQSTWYRGNLLKEKSKRKLSRGIQAKSNPLRTKGQASSSMDLSTKVDHSLLNKHSVFDVCLMNTINSIVHDDPMSWYIDSGTTRYVCKNKYLCLLIKVYAKGQVELMFMLGNLLVLRDVYYTPDISRNLVSSSLLIRLGYKLVFEADRCIISKSNLFIVCAYLQYNLFKLSIVCSSENYVYNVDIQVIYM